MERLYEILDAGIETDKVTVKQILEIDKILAGDVDEISGVQRVSVMITAMEFLVEYNHATPEKKREMEKI